MKTQYALSGMLLALTLALILEGALGLSLLYAWLIGINAFAFLLYGIDKLNSQSEVEGAVRVPEVSLLSYALVGGSLGALLAMLSFRHKVKKWGFLVPFILIMGAQIVLVYGLRASIPWR